MSVLLLIAGLLGFFFCIEKILHENCLKKVPIRIHVNGTRGKSSVTRLVIAGLRGGGYKVVGKTTGTEPKIIYPDGSEALFPRLNKPDIIEQTDFFREAVRCEAQAVVLECMAVRPDLQATCEKQIVKSTLSVITNVRADHLDVMGPGIRDVALALCGTLPARGGICITAEDNSDMLDVIAGEALKKGVRLDRSSAAGVTDRDMTGFSYLEHKENVALALAVTRNFGIKDDDALKAMHQANPDLGVLRVFHFTAFSKRIEFINAFAANDPNSILNIWIRMSRKFEPNQTRIVLLNTRKDRLQRSEQLAEFIARHLECDYLFLAGDDQGVIRNHFKRYAQGNCEVVLCGRRPLPLVYRHILRISAAKSSIYAIGNVGGVGHSYVDFFKRAMARKRPIRRKA